ncbi:unnamed protein product, partial [Rotaria socialis]
HKYPVLNTPTEDVMNTFHAKTKPVVNVMNSVKDTTTSTIQHGKDAVREFILCVYFSIRLLLND